MFYVLTLVDMFRVEGCCQYPSSGCVYENEGGFRGARIRVQDDILW